MTQMIPPWLRTFVATTSATLTGVVNVVTRRIERMSAELKPGDLAPDFCLPGSDGRTYCLHDDAGSRAVVIAWFPKAFTGG